MLVLVVVVQVVAVVLLVVVVPELVLVQVEVPTKAPPNKHPSRKATPDSGKCAARTIPRSSWGLGGLLCEGPVP